MFYALTRKSDGGVSIVRPQARPDGSVPTPEEIIAKLPADADELRRLQIPEEDIPRRATRDNIASVAAVEELPPRDALRDAWRCDGKTVSVNMDKARPLWRDAMRLARHPRFAALDRDYDRAVREQRQADADAIEAQRQELRDVPADPAIDKAKTPEALRKCWPACLSAKQQDVAPAKQTRKRTAARKTTKRKGKATR